MSKSARSRRAAGVFPPGGSNMGGNTRLKYIQKRTCAAGENFGGWWAVTSAPQAKILVILNTEMRFPKGKSMIWGFDFSKFSLPPSWVGNPVEISKFFPPYGGKIPEVSPPHPWGVFYSGGGGFLTVIPLILETSRTVFLIVARRE